MLYRTFGNNYCRFCLC